MAVLLINMKASVKNIIYNSTINVVVSSRNILRLIDFFRSIVYYYKSKNSELEFRVICKDCIEYRYQN